MTIPSTTTYADRVQFYEEQGCTTSDAQGIVDAEIMTGKFSPAFDPEHPLD